MRKGQEPDCTEVKVPLATFDIKLSKTSLLNFAPCQRAGKCHRSKAWDGTGCSQKQSRRQDQSTAAVLYQMHCWRATTVVCMQASRRWNQPTLSFRSLHKSVRCCHCCHYYCCTCKPHYRTLHHAELLHNMHRGKLYKPVKKVGSKQAM